MKARFSSRRHEIRNFNFPRQINLYSPKQTLARRKNIDGKIICISRRWTNCEGDSRRFIFIDSPLRFMVMFNKEANRKLLLWLHKYWVASQDVAVSLPDDKGCVIKSLFCLKSHVKEWPIDSLSAVRARRQLNSAALQNAKFTATERWTTTVWWIF